MSRASMETMTVIFAGKTYDLDEHGFLAVPEQWDTAFAEGMAARLGIFGGLTERHWSFIRYLRRKFLEEKTVPVVVFACADQKLRLWEFRQLFPTGYHRGACRIAGINYQFMYECNYWLTYETAAIFKSEFRMTPLGFLENFEQWNERFAELVLREWGMPDALTDRHRAIIAFLRDAYRRNRTIPTVFETCKATNLSLDELHDLFPAGYRRGACRMAGLPLLS
ncbi:MAG: TusE/DsrC/DsvC family sulfur relay protein [Planctomycetota bacterium]